MHLGIPEEIQQIFVPILRHMKKVFRVFSEVIEKLYY
jgi:hypothetical protein